jgi:hypothetical protein
VIPLYQIDRRSAYVSMGVVLGGFAFAWVLLPLTFRTVTAAGHFLDQPDFAMDYAKAIIWGAVLGGLLCAVPLRQDDKRMLLRGWGGRVFVTLVLMLAYENHYGLDAYGYFDARLITPNIRHVGFGCGTENIMALAWLHQQFLSDSYHSMKVTFSMVGLVAIYLFYRASVAFSGAENRRFFALLLLEPSIVFWSSILGKDPICLLGVGLYSYGVAKWARTERITYLIHTGAGIIIASLIRFWFSLILTIPLLVLFFRLGKRLSARTFLVVLIFAAVFILGKVARSFQIQSGYDLVTQTTTLARGFHAGGSAIAPVPVLTDTSSMVMYSPFTVFTVLFRPLPGEVNNTFGLLAGIEGVAMLILALLAIGRTRISELLHPGVLWGIALLFCWAGPNGFVISHNFGTAVRQRLQILPVMWGVLLYLSRSRGSRAADVLRHAPRPSKLCTLG